MVTFFVCLAPSATCANSHSAAYTKNKSLIGRRTSTYVCPRVAGGVFQALEKGFISIARYANASSTIVIEATAVSPFAFIQYHDQ